MFGFQLSPMEHAQYISFMPKYLQAVELQKKKWNKFRGKYRLENEVKTNSRRLRQLVRGGIPYEYRGEVWWVLSGANEAAARARQSNSPSYSQLTTMGTPFLRDIEKDVHRTFPDHAFFRTKENQERIRRVLIAFSNYAPKVGYCQSLNFIVGILLLFLSEERAFWVLTTIVSGDQALYYVQSMSGLLLDFKVLDHLASRKCPAIHSHLQNAGTSLQMLTTPWFLCLTLTSFPTETALRVLDCYFIEGAAVFQLVILAFLKIWGSEILHMQDFSDITTFFKEKSRTFFDFQLLLTTAFEAFGVFDAAALRTLREKYRREVEDQVLVRSLDELCMKTDMDIKSIQYIYARFVDSTRNAPGLDLTTFLGIGREYSSSSSDDAIENIFHLFDSDHDGYIDYIAATKAVHILEKDVQLRAKYKQQAEKTAEQ